MRFGGGFIRKLFKGQEDEFLDLELDEEWNFLSWEG